MTAPIHGVLQKDDNGYPVAGGVSSVNPVLVLNAEIDPSTGRLLVNNSGGGSGSITVTDGVTTVTGVTTVDFTSGATVTNGGGGTADVAISGGGSGTVTSVSVAAANGFAGTVANPTTTPAITLTTSITAPILAGNGTALIAATTTGSGTTAVLSTAPSISGATITTSTVNGVTLTTGGGTTTFLNANGAYSTPAGAGTVTSVAQTVPSFLSISGSPITSSGTLAISYSGTALPIANGGTAVTSVTTAPTATAFAGWDANKNLSANNHIQGYTAVTTAGATTTLTVGSTFIYYFTGSTTQTVTMPVVATLVAGMQWYFVNISSGAVTVQSSGGNTIVVMASQTAALFTVVGIVATDNTSWNTDYKSVVAVSGKKGVFSNSLTLTGTDGSSIAFGTGGTVLYAGSTIPLTVGSTTIASGTNTRVLFDNSGVLGEYTISGTGSVAMTASPALTGTPTAPTQTAGDNSTAIATDAFVTTAIANAIAGVDPAVSVSYATTSAGNTSGLTYNNGISGVGATFTGAANTAITIDGHTFVVGDVGVTRLLVKNDTQSPSGAFNGVYLFTALQTVGTGAIFTRALDYDTPSNINNTGAIPVLSGTANALTSWLLNTTVVTVGTTPITYTQFSFNPTGIVPPNLGGTGIANNASSTLTISGSFGTTLTVSGTTALTLPTSGTVTAQGNTVTGSGSIVLATSPTLVTPTLGAALATSINGNVFTTGSSTYTGTAAATYTFPGASATIAGLATTQTFTNKRITRRVVSTTQSATPTINTDNTDMSSITGLAQAITSMTTNLSGTPVQGDFLEVQITDNGTARAITWGTSFAASTVALPTTTVISTLLHVLFEWDNASSKWICVAVA